MNNVDMLNRYTVFLNILQRELTRMFDEQKEFIKCQEGCSACCEYGEYPFSELEFDYLMKGYKGLSQEEKETVKNNIMREISKKETSTEQAFMYCCPFLINKRCSVYENRGIICRTFGLLAEHSDGSYTMPFCHEQGLNYSQVYDEETKTIVQEKNGIKLSMTEPKAYRITRDTIQNLSIARDLGIDWGKSKTLLDFVIEYDLI